MFWRVRANSRGTITAGFLTASVVGGLGGCQSGPQPPAGWHARPAPEIAEDVSRDRDARMQVIICYGRFVSTHAALRLAVGDGSLLLWDPGGGYRVDDPRAVGRRADLVTRDVPTLGTWWQYRGSFTREPYNAVFEWDLAASDGIRLAEMLRAGTVDRGETGQFQTAAVGGACSLAVSEFLRRYGDPYATPAKKSFWPHDLGMQLWDESPDRVIVFGVDKEVKVWTRGE